MSDFVVEIVGDKTFSPKATSVPAFDKIIDDKVVLIGGLADGGNYEIGTVLEAEEDEVLYINGSAATSPYTFTDEGTYEVEAKEPTGGSKKIGIKISCMHKFVSRIPSATVTYYPDTYQIIGGNQIDPIPSFKIAAGNNGETYKPYLLTGNAGDRQYGYCHTYANKKAYIECSIDMKEEGTLYFCPMLNDSYAKATGLLLWVDGVNQGRLTSAGTKTYYFSKGTHNITVERDEYSEMGSYVSFRLYLGESDYCSKCGRKKTNDDVAKLDAMHTTLASDNSIADYAIPLSYATENGNDENTDMPNETDTEDTTVNYGIGDSIPFKLTAVMPYIDTTALDQKTQEHISYAEKNMKIYDTVHYEAVRPEYTYKLVSELRDTATGEIVVDNAGKKQVITTYFKADFDLQDNQYLTYGDVIPENHEGSGITFDVDAEFFAGRTLVVYERMYLENDYGTGSHLVAEHQVLLDEDQTIHVPKVWTSAIDSDTFTKTSFADGSTTIIDTFSYENLIPGFTYELKGYVLDRNQSITTGTNVTAAGTDGRLARNSVVFTPESSAGAVRLSFEVDTRKFGTKDYNGMVFVVYEELYVIQRYDGDDARSIVASHTDIADLNQTIYVPRITTNLTDKKTGTKIADADGTMQLTDTVNYYRFQPNTEYVIKGKLLDMQTGNVLTDGRGSRVEKTVSVMSSDTGTGEWQIDYEFDGTGLAGKIVVAYADVYIRNGERNDILSHVASHNDFWDESQRVYIPLISTVATDQKTNSHITYAEENVWVTDRISYSFLKPDTEYRLVSKLVDKDTGEVVVDDKGMEQVFTSDLVTTPNESQEKYNQIVSNPLTDSSDTGIGYSYGYIIPADGTVLPDGTPYRGVVFTFDAHTFEGRTLVIYEELQIRTAGSTYMTVARHTDINDENQTVHIPKIRTNAVDSETLTHSSKMDGSMTIIDTVKYENLIPGFTYVLEGYLMDKPRDDTKGCGKIKDKDGNYITNRIEFTPDRPSGEVKLSLSGNASEFQTDEGAFSSETLVVFERLYLKDNKDASDELLIVASHEDINDENQTIYCPRISTKVVAYDLGEESKDGDADHVIGYTAYECGYCKTRFQTEKEAKTHIDSSIKCKNMGAKVNSVTEATIYDRVYYENLIPDRTYSMVGHLIDTKTGKAVLINQRAVQSEEKYFTPGTANGEVDVVFHVTGLDLAGGRYVVYEELFLDGVSIAEHKDFYDENQTFYVPSMVTSAYDINTRTNIAKNDTKSTIIDEVQLSGLKEGQNYYLSSILMDKETGSQFIDGSGRTVSASAWRKKGGSVWNYYEDGKKIL